MMRAVSAFSPVSDPYRAGLHLGEQLAGLKPEVVLLFSSIHLGESPELQQGLFDALHSEPVLIGNSGDGTYSSSGAADLGASALALNSDGSVRWEVFSAPDLAADPAGATRAVLAAANDWLQGRPAAFMLMFCDFNTDASEIEKVIGEQGNVPIIGGLAADDNQMRNCSLFAGHALLQDHIVLLAADGPVNFSVHIGNSIAPIGQPGMVEAAEGKVVSRISGMSSQAFVEQQAGKEVMESDRGITSLHIIDADQPGIKRLRSIVPHFAQTVGALGLYGGIEAGRRVQVCMARPEDLIKEVYAIAERERERKPVAALIVSCVGRKSMLGDDLHHEVDALQQTFAGLPLAGFPSFGEIGPLRLPDGSYSRNLFHNMTYVLLLIET